MPFPSDMLDEINLKIIDILSRDASISFVDIARELQISDATVHMRVKRLISSGILRKFTVITDNRLLGYGYLAFMGINIKQGFTDDMTKLLSEQEDVLEIHEMHGRFDLLIKIRARNLEEMRDIIVKKVRNLPQITDAELMTVLKTIKEEQSVSVTRDIADKTRAEAI